MPASISSIPTPVGGWNAFDALDNMPPNDAVVLDNFFPQTSKIVLRRGYTQFCATGENAPVGTLMEWGGGSGSKLLAAVNGKIFDITSGTASSKATGYGSDIWSFTNFSTPAGQFLLAANDSGLDTPFVYDGATVAPIVAVGPTLANLCQVAIYQQRTFYVERNTLKVWYTDAGAYQGTLTSFDFGQFCTRGGKIAAIATWTRDNGFGGVDDLFVVVTTRGELLVYNGPNPGSSTTWAMQGRFVLGEPVKGPHCVVRTGPDLLLLCEDGFQPLSEYLTTGSTRAQVTDIAKKIGNAASDAVKSYKSNDYWQGCLYPAGTQLIVNVPTSSTVFQQYVVNTTTGAWCRYLNLNAYCWSLFNGSPYFGGAAGKVYQWDTGPSDNGSDIVGEVVTAFSYLGQRGRQKRYTMIRPVVETNGSLSYSLGVNVDYDTSATLPIVSSNVSSASLWGSGSWGSAIWGGTASFIQRRWNGVHGIGYAVAVHLKVATHTISVAVNSFDLASEPGGPI